MRYTIVPFFPCLTFFSASKHIQINFKKRELDVKKLTERYNLVIIACVNKMGIHNTIIHHD